MEQLEKELTLEMIPDGLHRQIAEEIGVENLIRLARLTGGHKFYLAKADQLLQPVRDKHIRCEFTGYNSVALAKKYNLSETHIRRLCGKGCLDEQLKFF